MGGEKVFLSIVSERARALVVVRESWTRVHRWDASARRGADAGNDSDEVPPPSPPLSFCLLFSVTPSLHASGGGGRSSFASQRFIGL